MTHKFRGIVTHDFEDFSHYHFSGQRDDEKILWVIHRHWFDITMHYALIAVVVILQLISIIMAEEIIRVFELNGLSLWTVLFVNSVILIWLWFYGFIIWIDYWLDVWVVTDQRVINIEQKGLFSRHVSELHFHTVQDVTTKVRGFIPTLLNFGDVEVQTAAEHSRFLFRRVPDPYAIKAMLVQRQREAYQESIGKEVGQKSDETTRQ